MCAPQGWLDSTRYYYPRLQIRVGQSSANACSKEKGQPRRIGLSIWSGRRVSNSRPIPWQGIALPTELLPQNLEARAGVEPTYTDLQSGA